MSTLDEIKLAVETLENNENNNYSILKCTSSYPASPADCNIVTIPEMKKIFPESAIRKEIIGEIIGFDRIENSEASDFISNLTGDNSKEVVAFGTEAWLFQEIGIITVVCGPGSIEQAHKIDEFITLEQIKKCLVLLDSIYKNSSTN